MATKTRPRRSAPPVAPADPVASAKQAGLRYITDTKPGIRRQRTGKSFTYLDCRGHRIRNSVELDRIRALAIPPAWTDVWISPDPLGHLQATGRDNRYRKQYRYHPQWRSVRDETKYGRMMAFANALPRIRRQIAADLDLPGLPRPKVLATLVRLLETTQIRVGNEEYVQNNGSFGLTTMRDRHVAIEKQTIHFRFRGKSGVYHKISLTDPRLARVVKKCRDLPGQDLFQYKDQAGEPQSIGSVDVNDYLREAAGEEFTAKDFRTWAGTVLAALALREFEAFDSAAQAKKNVVQAIERVAQRLGNTPTVCRKCYIHPEIIDAYLDGAMLEPLKQRAEQELTRSIDGFRPEEAAVLALLQQRLSHPQANRPKSGTSRAKKLRT